MRRMVHTLSVGIVALVATQSATAKPCLTVLARQVQTVQVQPVQPQMEFRGTISQTPWFSDPEIRQHIRLNEEQYNRLNKAYGTAWTSYQQSINELGKTLTDEQRQQRMRELETNFYRTYSTSTNEIITDAQARDRYNQLYLQYRGYDAFYDPMVQQKLNLTDEQRQMLGQYRQEWSKSMGDFSRTYVTDRDGTTKRFNEMRTRDFERTNKILTEQQRQAWRQLSGEPYSFQPGVYFQTTARPPQK